MRNTEILQCQFLNAPLLWSSRMIEINLLITQMTMLLHSVSCGHLVRDCPSPSRDDTGCKLNHLLRKKKNSCMANSQQSVEYVIVLPQMRTSWQINHYGRFVRVVSLFTFCNSFPTKRTVKDHFKHVGGRASPCCPSSCSKVKSSLSLAIVSCTGSLQLPF